MFPLCLSVIRTPFCLGMWGWASGGSRPTWRQSPSVSASSARGLHGTSFSALSTNHRVNRQSFITVLKGVVIVLMTPDIPRMNRASASFLFQRHPSSSMDWRCGDNTGEMDTGLRWQDKRRDTGAAWLFCYRVCQALLDGLPVLDVNDTRTWWVQLRFIK